MTDKDKIREASIPDFTGTELTQKECYQLGYQAALANAVPDGWKLVPIIPTPKMIHAAYTDRNGNFGSESQWEAMLNASPSPDSEKS